MTDLEAARAALQAALDAQKSASDRNRLGQYATPAALAREVVALGLAHLPIDRPLRVLEPSAGTGAFIAALLDRADRPPDDLLAVELDAHYGAPAADLWRDEPVRFVHADFTQLDPDPTFTLVVANPPYVRHHHLAAGNKARLLATSRRIAGVPVSGLSGLYVHFLLHSLAWMAPGAVGVWLIPSEFMDVGYGSVLRELLRTRLTLLHLHRADPHEAAFHDALVSTAVLVFRNQPPADDHEATWTFGGTLTTPAVTARRSQGDLRAASRWSGLHQPPATTPTHDQHLGDLFTIRRGLATGDNAFFLLHPADTQALPAEVLRPILPSPRYVPGDRIEADADGLPVDVPFRYLLDCRWPDDEVARRSPALAERFATAHLTRARYLCRHRTPWYAQERRPPAPILCTYMGRGAGGGRPLRFVRNRSQATAGNVWLMLYPKQPMSEAALDAVWAWLVALDPDVILREARVYGGGLHKLEPGELARLPIPSRLVG